MNRIICLLLVAAVGLVQSEEIQSPEDFLYTQDLNNVGAGVGYFNNFNKYLVEKLASKDPAENIEQAKKMPEDRHVIPWVREYLDIFTSLPESLNSCDFKSYLILAKNYICTENRSHQEGAQRRVDAIVNYYAKEHANKCRPQYMESFTQHYASVPKKAKHAVTRLFNEFSSVDVIKTGLDKIQLSDEDITKILEVMETRVKGTPEQDLLYATVDELKGEYTWPAGFANLYEQELISPCRIYYDIMANVFAPARFDALIEDGQQKGIIEPSDESFKREFINTRLCFYFLRQNQIEKFQQVIKNRTTRSD